MKDIDSVGEVTREAIDLLGMRAGPDFALAVKEGRFEFEDYLALIEDAEGIVKSTAEESLTFGEAMLKMKNKVAVALEPLGKQIMNVFEETLLPALEKLINFLGKAMTAFENLPKPVKDGIIIFFGLLAAVSPVLLILKSLMGVVL